MSKHDEIYARFSKNQNTALLSVFKMSDGDKYLRATPKREASDDLYEALRAAIDDPHTVTDADYRPGWIDKAEMALAKAEEKEG